MGATAANLCSLGVWRSLVARSVRVGEVPSSNLGTPIAPEKSQACGASPSAGSVLCVIRHGSGTDTSRLHRLPSRRERRHADREPGDRRRGQELGEGKRVASFVLAVDRATKDGGADFVRIAAWDEQAELCSQFLHKGHRAAARRTPAQPVVGGRRRHAPQRPRGRREPRRVPRVAGRRGGSLDDAFRGARPWPRLRAPWRHETRSSPSPTSCSTSGSFRDYGPMGIQVVGADEVTTDRVRRLRLAGAVRASGAIGCRARARPPRPPLGRTSRARRPRG